MYGNAPGMRVLHLIDSGGFYGAEQVLVGLAREQVRQGLRPTILSAGEPEEPTKALEAEAERQGVSLVPWRMEAGFNHRQAREIFQWAICQGFDIGHSHGYKFNILGAFCQTQHCRLPIVATLHGYTASGRLSRLWLYQQVDLMALKRLEAWVLVSPAMKGMKGIKRLPAGRTYVIPNGLQERAPEPAELPPSVRDFRARFKHCWVAIGRLSPEKGHDVLLRAMAKLSEKRPDCGVVILGDGPEADSLYAQSKRYRISEHVLFAGYVREAARLLPHFDALIMPSYTEGLPMTVLEAMRASIPVIATRVGGMPDALAAVDGQELAQLVPPGDPERLAATLGKLAADEEWAIALADHGRERFVANYTVSSMVARYEECYREALRRAGRDTA